MLAVPLNISYVRVVKTLALSLLKSLVHGYAQYFVTLVLKQRRGEMKASAARKVFRGVEVYSTTRVHACIPTPSQQ